MNHNLHSKNQHLIEIITAIPRREEVVRHYPTSSDPYARDTSILTITHFNLNMWRTAVGFHVVLPGGGGVDATAMVGGANAVQLYHPEEAPLPCR